MNNIAIKTRNLGKKYEIDKAQKAMHRNLREDLINLFRVNKLCHETFWALQSLDLEINFGEVVGIVGANGSGKSTLLKLLSRVSWPSTGEIELNGRVGALLEVGTGFHAELTGRENIFLCGAILGMHRGEVEQYFDEIIAFSGIEDFLDTPVKRYSNGMFLRLAFAVMAYLKSEILIVDEVIAVGDIIFQEKCLIKMKEIAKEGKTILFVSHNMKTLHSLCKRILWMEKGRLIADGLKDEILDKYEHSTLSTTNSNVKPLYI